MRAHGLRERLTQKPAPDEETRTIVVVDGGAICAASHIRRFADDGGPEAEIVWVVSWPNHEEALDLLLEHILDSLSALPPESIPFSQEVYVPAFVGMCDPWPHLRSAIRKAGFSHLPRQNEAAYAGPIHLVEKLDPPVPEVQLKRDIGKFGPRFRATLGDNTISQCECCFGFSQFESVPAMRGWVELSEIRTDGEWRSMGIGKWVVQSAINWLHSGGYRNAILTVAQDDEERGAGRFYSKFGWRPICRMEKGWKRWTRRER